MHNARRILGIDPGLGITGYAVLEASPSRPVIREAGVIRTADDNATDLAAKVHSVYKGVVEVIAQSDEFLPEFSNEFKTDALELIRSLKDDAKEISLRTLISVTKIRASGNKNWKGMATYILCN